MFFIIIEGAVLMVFTVFVVSQVILPAAQGRALFPLFRKQGSLEKDLAELNQQEVEAQLEAEKTRKLNATQKGVSK